MILAFSVGPDAGVIVVKRGLEHAMTTKQLR